MSTPSESAAEALDGLSEREVSLLRSAYRVVSRRGGHRIALQDVADDAGVSKGLVLYHFKTKDNLLLSTMRWALVRTAERIREGVGSVQAAEDVVKALIDAIWIGPQPNRDFYLLYLDLVEHAARVPSFAELPGMTRDIINGLYAEVIAEGLDRGLFHVDDVDEAAEAMRAYLDGLFIQWLQREDWETTHDAYRERCRGGLLRLLGADRS
ncbi:TetR/AcrR family transcriptional regulator [Euzebya sp.]|uniref:TetR/AcrR family transcriptional regulator n=1 Tax=Euzebya sp. TaxID=1971409 RepID=UPI003519029B